MLTWKRWGKHQHKPRQWLVVAKDRWDDHWLTTLDLAIESIGV
jgi:hypothetical protein